MLLHQQRITAAGCETHPMCVWPGTRCASRDRSSGGWHRNCCPPRHQTRTRPRQRQSWCGRNVSPAVKGRRGECARCLFASKKNPVQKTNGKCFAQIGTISDKFLTNQEGKLEQATTTDARLTAEDVHVITGHRNWKIAEEKKTSELTLNVKNLITYQQVGGFSPV